jgi:dihydroflavonol-4-reductase
MRLFITGANGHLGNNLVRFLRNEGHDVTSGIRHQADSTILAGFSTGIEKINYRNVSTMARSFEGHDAIFHTAAVFKRWSANPQKDIIAENILLSKNVIKAAAMAGVSKIIYTSSIAAMSGRDFLDESTWNSDKNKWYPYSKAESEKMASEEAEKGGIDFISILPSAIIGPNFQHLTPTLRLFSDIYTNKLPFIPNFRFLMVDARDVAKASYLALLKGKKNRRYIVSHPQAVHVRELIKIAKEKMPERNIKMPNTIGKSALFALARFSELAAQLLRSEPLLSLEDAKEYWDANPHFDNTKTKTELGFVPVSMENSIIETFKSVATQQMKVVHRNWCNHEK